MSSYKIGQEILFNGFITTIVDIKPGRKTNKRNMQSGIMFTGYKSTPCTYILSNGYRVKGSTIKKYKK